MTKNFNLSFKNDEEYLLDEGKAKFGNKLGSVLKDGLRVALNAPTENADAEPNDCGEFVAGIIGRAFDDIFDMGLTEWAYAVGDARAAIRGRMRDLYIKHPKEYSEIEYQLRRQHPELEKYL